MAVDIKEKIEELVGKIKNDPKTMESFKDDPIKTLEDLLGVDLPEDQLKTVADGIKAKLTVDKISDVAGTLGGIFKK